MPDPISSPDVQSGPEIEVCSPTKLDKVLESLRANDGVYLPGEPIFGKAMSSWAETATIIAGSNRPLLGRDGNALNAFMYTLCPKDLKPSARDETRGWSPDQQMEVPKLYFDEPIGIKRIRQVSELVVKDMRAFDRLGLVPGQDQKEWEEILSRRTWLYVYPDIELAKAAYDQMTGKVALERGVNLGFRIPADVMLNLEKQHRSPRNLIRSLTGQ